MKEVGIGLLGFGTVGAGVVEALQVNGELAAERSGVRLRVVRIADLDLATDRGVEVDRSLLTTDARAVVADPDVDIVVELIGGTGPARELILESLGSGKPVVTANKALLAEHGVELFSAAAAAGVDLCFEAAVCGGIPIIRALSRGLVVNRIQRIHGILNGTCNYILTRMSREGLPFDQVLAEAQAAGYAEADPGLDIDGLDAAHKAAILASLAYGCAVPLDAVRAEGIRGMAQDDIEYARDLGYSVKLLAVIRDVVGEIEIRVHPALVQSDHMLASVGGVFNAVLVKGDVVDETLYYGKGAGRRPTASAVVSDLMAVARRLASGAGAAPLVCRPDAAPIREPGRVVSRSYLRMSLLDQPGVLARICSALGSEGISIASVLQKEARAGEHVPVVIVTHAAEERRFARALAEIDAMDVVGERTIRLRIEDFE